MTTIQIKNKNVKAFSFSKDTNFTIPSVGNSQTQMFDYVAWVAGNQFVFFSDGVNYGTFQVTHITDTTLTLKNVDGDTNGTIIQNGAKLTATGKKGELTVLDQTEVVNTVTTGIIGSSKITNAISLSQADYDAIVTPDSQTLYIISS